ncbi:MAG: hypothetical protein U9Q81_02075 [Pseudomonadota bacterium]|nr:hypothetical protein [Pseudomonadota bacterium]
MEEASGLDKPTPSPPNRGLSLGWRLALSTALIISLVMGGISVTQQLLESRKDREVRRELLKLSLAPLAARLETAVTPDSMQRDVEEFHAAYVSKGYSVHDVELLDAAGREVLSTRVSAVSEEGADYLRAEIAIASPLLDGGQGTLVALNNIQEYRDAVRRNWLLWVTHFAVTVGALFLFLAAAIYFQVTRPVNRLVQGVTKMEMGYWGPIDIGGGAWEIRWLAWRFGNMAQEVRNSMTHLFEAERKAQSLMPERAGIFAPANPQPPLELDAAPSDPAHSPVFRELMAVCRRLEAASPDDPQAVQLARGVWRQEALEANRFGFHQLKARLEDAALRLIEPDAYASLDKRLGELKASWGEWAKQLRNDLSRVLEDKAIPCVGVLYRVKHTAGVWAKMHGKGLGLDEVYDLFAFRIIVPTEADCYAALGVIHRVYKPEVSRFKDYIARPKSNGYRSVHTCVKAEDGPVFEVQIRSMSMDRQAERGDSAHWIYKKVARDQGSTPFVTQWWQKLWRRSGEPPA